MGRYLKGQKTISLNYFSIHLKLHVIESDPFNEGQKRSYPNMRQIETKDGMKAQKADKPLVVFLPNALSDPNAVMIILGDAHLAY